ncbi:MAG: hypothetical protein JJU29_11115 [Verrucomicrobia bacterium]|nr:hypothetical protein [Verrucomicrobiota bacterium]MCH8510569.1 hypothetical protein [Kiritimatiellia bacterium]
MTDPVQPHPQDAPLPGTPQAPDAPPPPPPPKSSGKGCWFYGCGGCLGVVLIFIIAGFVMTQRLKSHLNQPAHAPLVLTAEDETTVEETRELLKLSEEEDFLAALPAEGLRLTSSQLIALLEAENPDMKDKVRLHLEPDLFRADIRVPREEGSDQHFVVQVTLYVVQVNDRVEIRLRDARFGPFGIPRFIMKELENEDFMAEFFADEENRRIFQETIETIEVQQDAILIVPRRQQ